MEKWKKFSQGFSCNLSFKNFNLVSYLVLSEVTLANFLFLLVTSLILSPSEEPELTMTTEGIVSNTTYKNALCT